MVSKLLPAQATIAQFDQKFPRCLATSAAFLRPCDVGQGGSAQVKSSPLSPGTGHCKSTAASSKRHRPYAARLASWARIRGRPGCTILGKAEFMNPGGSVKDRAGRADDHWRPRSAASSRPAGLIVEATAGNTGIGLALGRQCARLPHADRHSRHPKPGKEGHAAAVRRRAGRGAGGALFNPNNYQACRATARRAAAEGEPKRRVIFADQWNNLDNRKAHLRLDRAGDLGSRPARKVDGFICAIGTGRHDRRRVGILCARRRRRRHRLSPIRGARRCTTGSRTARQRRPKAARSPKASVSGRVTPIIDGLKIDKLLLIPDEEALPLIFDLLEHEGLCLGGSSGINIARRHPPCARSRPRDTPSSRSLADFGTRYQSEAVQPGLPALQEIAGDPIGSSAESHIKPPFEKA